MASRRARWTATLAVIIACAAGCGYDDDFGEPDEQTIRDVLACGEYENHKPQKPQKPPPGAYVDHKLAIDYDRLAIDQPYAGKVLFDPARLEQVYADAVAGEVRAQWAVCLFEATSRGGGRKAAAKLAGLRCQTIARCEFRFDKLPYSDTTASGTRMLVLIADEFEAVARSEQLKQEIVSHALTLFVGVAALRARAAALRARASGGPRPSRQRIGPHAKPGGESGKLRGLTEAELAGVRGAGPVRRFGSFSSFKRAMGPAGAGKEWHHIVGQTKNNVRRFGPESIHNTSNVIRIDAKIHRKISGYYSSIRDFSKPLRVRDWLGSQSFEAQRTFGITTLRDYGAIP